MSMHGCSRRHVMESTAENGISIYPWSRHCRDALASDAGCRCSDVLASDVAISPGTSSVMDQCKTIRFGKCVDRGGVRSTAVDHDEL